MPIYFIDFERPDEQSGTRRGIAVVVADDDQQAKSLTDRELFGYDGRRPRILKAEEMEVELPGVVLMLDHVTAH